MLSETDFRDLLIVNDAINDLRTVEVILTGGNSACSLNDGVIGALSKIQDIISRNSPTYKENDDDALEEFWEIVDDKNRSIDERLTWLMTQRE